MQLAHKNTFGCLTLGNYSMLSKTIAGPIIDYTHWGQDFTTSTSNDDFTFDQALHNMDPHEFRDLLFTEDLHEPDDPTVYSWTKGTFRAKSYRPMTLCGLRTMAPPVAAGGRHVRVGQALRSRGHVRSEDVPRRAHAGGAS